MLAIPTFAEGNEILTPTSCTIENKRVYEPLKLTSILQVKLQLPKMQKP